MASKNFMDHLAPNAAQAADLSGADQRYQEVMNKRKEREETCPGGYCSPMMMTQAEMVAREKEYMRDAEALNTVRKRGDRGGQKFCPSDAF